ncbi:MAG: glucose-6-phosphate 1-dehydrogenase, partial [Pseudomonadota bacterium]
MAEITLALRIAELDAALPTQFNHLFYLATPPNVFEPITALLADAGIPMGVMRGVALLARCAGLLGHLVEEQTDPIGIDLYMNVDRNID